MLKTPTGRVATSQDPHGLARLRRCGALVLRSEDGVGPHRSLSNSALLVKTVKAAFLVRLRSSSSTEWPFAWLLIAGSLRVHTHSLSRHWQWGLRSEKLQ